MSTISTILSTLRSAVWAIDVRDEIANAIEQCYKDVNSPSLVTDGIEEVIGDMVDNGRISGAIVEDLGLITEGTSNLFDFTTVTAGRLNTSTGEVGEASGYWTSDFILVENGKTYYFANTDRRVAYNSSKAYSANISGTTWTASADGYIRVSVTSANRKTAKINEGSAKDYRPGRSPIDFNLRDDVYRKAEVDAALAAVTIATDPELETAGAAADAKATGDAISVLNESLGDFLSGIPESTIEDIGKALIVKTVENHKVTEWELGKTTDAIPYPESPLPKYGTNGQVLTTKGNGKVEWTNAGQPSASDISNSVASYLSAHPEATTTVLDGSITEEKLSSDLANKLNAAIENLLVVENVFDCSGIGESASDDTALIQQILLYAKTNNYTKILFPKDSHWLLLADAASYGYYYTINIPTHTIVDLNGSTWEVDGNNVRMYYLITFDRDSEHSCICNGTIIGDRKTNSSATGNIEIIRIRGVGNSIKNMVIKDASGDGATLGDGSFITQNFFWGHDTLGNYTYASGTAVEDSTCLSSPLYTLSDYYNFTGDLIVLMGIGSLFNMADILYDKNVYQIVYFYDENQNVIKTKTMTVDGIIPKIEIPTSSKYFRFEIQFNKEIVYNNENARWGIMEMVSSYNCSVEECHFENIGRNGICISSSIGSTVKDTVIDSVNGFSPKAGIDIEPSRGKPENVLLDHVKIGEDTAAAVYISVFSMGMKIRDCEFSSRFTSARGNFLTIERTVFRKGTALGGDSYENVTVPKIIANQCQFFGNVTGFADVHDSVILSKGLLSLGYGAKRIRLFNCFLKVGKFETFSDLLKGCTIDSYDGSSIEFSITRGVLEDCELNNIQMIKITGNSSEDAIILKNNRITRSSSSTFGIFYSVGNADRALDRLVIVDNSFYSNGAFYATFNNRYTVNELRITGNDFENPITLDVDHESGQIRTAIASDVIHGFNRNLVTTVV